MIVYHWHCLYTSGTCITAAAQSVGLSCLVIDAFGEAPLQWWEEDDFMVRGLKPQEVLRKIDANPESEIIVLYAANLTYHRSLISLLKKIKNRFPEKKVVVMENTQAVTAYSLRNIQEKFFDAGADFILTGEPEERGLELFRKILEKQPFGPIEGVGRRVNGHLEYTPPRTKVENLDKLPFAAWELFPLENYWSLKYAHGPMGSKRYLPILTSRGCPYSCRFCVIPETNDNKWRAKTPARVVEEFAYYQKKFGVNEFHIEDVNPTVQDNRTK
jgi:radical SAM superfamily enzyme YgiQ (UPF0313 family)